MVWRGTARCGEPAGQGEHWRDGDEHHGHHDVPAGGAGGDRAGGAARLPGHRAGGVEGGDQERAPGVARGGRRPGAAAHRRGHGARTVSTVEHADLEAWEAYVRVPWRRGTQVGRTIYACPPGSSYRQGEVLI